MPPPPGRKVRMPSPLSLVVIGSSELGESVIIVLPSKVSFCCSVSFIRDTTLCRPTSKGFFPNSIVEVVVTFRDVPFDIVVVPVEVPLPVVVSSLSIDDDAVAEDVKELEEAKDNAATNNRNDIMAVRLSLTEISQDAQVYKIIKDALLDVMGYMY
jgi:hypothetical protein